ncbi:hypothetical protein LC612_23130 [Nostoc sp. CHAB 5834]|nr:hypothetical protein [Nostoc sp. CHAB 5834]
MFNKKPSDNQGAKPLFGARKTTPAADSFKKAVGLRSMRTGGAEEDETSAGMVEDAKVVGFTPAPPTELDSAPIVFVSQEDREEPPSPAAVHATMEKAAPTVQDSQSDQAPRQKFGFVKKASAEVRTVPSPAAGASVPDTEKKSLFGFKKKEVAANSKASPVEPQAQGEKNPSLFGKFLNKATSEKGATTTPHKSLKSKLGLGGSLASGGSLKKGDKPGTKPTKKAAKSFTGAGTGKAVDVLVELESNKRVYWRVTADSTDEVPAAEVTKALSFSNAEKRFVTPEGAVSYSQAQDIALSEIGEDVRIINASKEVSAVYASRTARIDELMPIKTSSGLLALDMLMKSEREQGEEVILALLLSSADGSPAVVVLYHFGKDNEVQGVQISVNPEGLSFVLNQFASSRKLNVDNTKVVLFKNEDLLKIAAAVPLFPTEAQWRGVPVRQVVWTAALVCASVAGAVSLYGAKEYVAKEMASSELSKLRTQKSTLQTQVNETLQRSVQSFSRSQSLDLDVMTERAGELWTPGAAVVVDATVKTQTYNVTLPLSAAMSADGRPSVLFPVSLSDVQPLFNNKVPENCSKAIPEISGGMNVVQVTVTCEDLAGPLSSYSLN